MSCIDTIPVNCINYLPRSSQCYDNCKLWGKLNCNLLWMSLGCFTIIADHIWIWIVKPLHKFGTSKRIKANVGNANAQAVMCLHWYKRLMVCYMGCMNRPMAKVSFEWCTFVRHLNVGLNHYGIFISKKILSTPTAGYGIPLRQMVLIVSYFSIKIKPKTKAAWRIKPLLRENHFKISNF